MTKFPLHICIWCNEENPTDNHKMTCAETFKPKKFVPTPQWINVKDKLPPKWKKVLVYAKYFEAYQDQLNEHGDWFDSDPQANVTHWMELPEAPK